ncbi:MAG: hypothetical protein J6567_00715 [Gilliamella sp.]|nr:hypothetical protein [Gilliamella sp.]MCO6549784.1 hypothetical protein [Gilliamella sp.]
MLVINLKIVILFFHPHNQQSLAIKQATNSPYIHMVIIFNTNGKPYIFETANKVIYTPLTSWVSRGKIKNYVITRLKNHNLSRMYLSLMAVFK